MGILLGRRRGRPRSIFRHVPLIRWFGPGLTLAGIVATAYFLLTGRIDFSALDQSASVDSPAPVQTVTLEGHRAKTPEAIRIATFNIKVFGQKKSSDAEIMGHLATIVTAFDVVAIQEIRHKTSLPVDRLVELINNSGGSYRAVTSEPIGRTSSKEAYAFVWDDQRIQLEPESAYVVRDEADRLHREPLVASFQARTVPADGRLPFRFTLINMHTDPDEVGDLESEQNELHALDDVFHRVREYEYSTSGETDFILLGDLNAAADKLGELGAIPEVVSVLGNTPTNTVKTATYDHILLDRRMTREYLGRAGVIDFVTYLGVSDEKAPLISDHLPVWAEFSAYEVPDVAADAKTAAAPRSPTLQ